MYRYCSAICNHPAAVTQQQSVRLAGAAYCRKIPPHHGCLLSGLTCLLHSDTLKPFFRRAVFKPLFFKTFFHRPTGLIFG
jgi:hypothetical protein